MVGNTFHCFFVIFLIFRAFFLFFIYVQLDIVRRIYICSVYKYLEVTVWAGTSSRASYSRQSSPLVYLLTGTYIKRTAVCIQCLNISAMVNHDSHTVSSRPAGRYYGSSVGCSYCGSRRCRIVKTVMPSSPSRSVASVYAYGNRSLKLSRSFLWRNLLRTFQNNLAYRLFDYFLA